MCWLRRIRLCPETYSVCHAWIAVDIIIFAHRFSCVFQQTMPSEPAVAAHTQYFHSVVLSTINSDVCGLFALNYVMHLTKHHCCGRLRTTHTHNLIPNINIFYFSLIVEKIHTGNTFATQWEWMHGLELRAHIQPCFHFSNDSSYRLCLGLYVFIVCFCSRLFVVTQQRNYCLRMPTSANQKCAHKWMRRRNHIMEE